MDWELCSLSPWRNVPSSRFAKPLVQRGHACDRERPGGSSTEPKVLSSFSATTPPHAPPPRCRCSTPPGSLPSGRHSPREFLASQRLGSESLPHEAQSAVR